MKKQYRRWLASKILHCAAHSIEQGCLMLRSGGVMDSIRDRKRWRDTFTEKELRLIDQRRKKLWELGQDIRILARHLEKS